MGLIRQLFIAPQIGTGTAEDPYRSVLNDLIDVQAGESFDEVDHPARRRSVCFVRAADATLDAIAATANVSRLSPKIEEGELAATLDLPLSTWPTQLLLGTRSTLELGGIPCDGIGASSTLRQLLGRILKTLFVAQVADGRSAAMVAVMTAGLDSTVGSLSAAVRQAALTWLSQHGVDTSGWTLATTIRTVILSAVTNFTWRELRFGGHTL